MTNRSYRKLPACRIAMRLIQEIYTLAAAFPEDEKSGLTATIKRSATSINAQLAVVASRWGSPESTTTLDAADIALQELLAYLDVADRLRLTASWRFRHSRRLALKLSKRIVRLAEMLGSEQQQFHLRPAA